MDLVSNKTRRRLSFWPALFRHEERRWHARFSYIWPIKFCECKHKLSQSFHLSPETGRVSGQLGHRSQPLRCRSSAKPYSLAHLGPCHRPWQGLRSPQLGRSWAHLGKSKNLSQGGMKITALEPLERNATILLELNLKLLSNHIQTKKILMAPDNRIIAEVVWRHLDLATGLFEAGLHFVDANRRREFETLMHHLEELD